MPVPSPSADVNSEHWYRHFVDQDRRAAAAESSLAVKASVTQTWEQSFYLLEPEDGDYRVVVAAAVARTITAVTTRCTSGTTTLTVKINATALGGTANSVSASESTQPHASDNAITAGDDIVLTFSSSASPEGVSVTLSGTVTLAA